MARAARQWLPSRMSVMAETATVSTQKPKKPVASANPSFEAPKFEIPKFEMPKFDVPNMEMPAAFRELAEKGIAQAKENYEKVKSAAEQATDVLEETYSTASKGCTDLGLKMIETARTNTNAAFDLYGDLMGAKSFAEVVEKSTAYLRDPVREPHRAEQGIDRVCAEGRHRDCPACEGEHVFLQGERLISVSVVSCRMSPGESPGFLHAQPPSRALFVTCQRGGPPLVSARPGRQAGEPLQV